MRTNPSPYGDAAVAVCLLIGSIAYFVAAGREATAVERDIVGQAGFPRAIAVVGMVCATAVLVRAVMKMRTTPIERQWPSLARWRPLALWVATVLYVIMIRPVGFPIATTAYVLLGLFLLGFRRKLRASMIAIGTAAGLFLIFDVLLGVDLPDGPLLELVRGRGA